MGAVWIAAASKHAAARGVSILFGSVYLLVGRLGLFLIGSELNILALHAPDNLLHLATAGLALGLGLSTRSVAPTPA